MEQTKQQTLVQQAVIGDKHAFAQLVNLHSSFVYKLAFRFLFNAEDARDVVQEVFIRVWKNLKQYNTNIKFTTWLYKITVNKCLDVLKSQKRKYGKHNGSIELNELTIKNNDELANIEMKDLVEKIKQLTVKLLPKQKLIFVLHFIEEKSFDEIADITGFSKGNIKSNLYYARKNMQQYLNSVINYSTI